MNFVCFDIFLLVLAITHLAASQSAALSSSTSSPSPTPLVDPCPLPLRFNPAIQNCSVPCIVSHYTLSQMNGVRLFLLIMGWINCLILGSILVLYTMWAPKKWVQFPGNMMLVWLVLSMLYQSQYLFSTGYTYKGYVCKNDFEAISSKDLTCSWQGGWGIFWSHFVTVWVCMLGLQLFLTVNRLLPRVSAVQRFIFYFTVSGVSSLISVVICQFHPDSPWGPNSSGNCGSRSVNTLRWAYLFPLTIFAGFNHVFLIWAAFIILKKSGLDGVRRQKRLLLFTGVYLFMIDWSILYGWISLHRASFAASVFQKWVACSAATGNDPSCKGSPRIPFAIFVISNIFLSTITTVVAIIYTMTSETLRLAGTAVNSASTKIGFSTETNHTASGGERNSASSFQEPHVESTAA